MNNKLFRIQPWTNMRYSMKPFLIQQETMEELKKTYEAEIKDLEALYIPRPPKPDHDTLLKMKEGMSLKQAGTTEEAAPADAAAPPPPAPEGGDLPAEPGPAIEAAPQQPAEVAA